MYASTLVAAGFAALASAAPATSSTNQYAFEVTNFVFGCSAGCYYNFDVTAPDSGLNHPAITTPVHCSGGLDQDTDYVTCGTISETQSIAAYIVKATNELKLRYEVNVPTETGGRYDYYGEKEVYSATGDDASKQSANFSVPETSATGVA